MGMYYDAHRDARLALNFADVNKEKAYFRKAKAEYLMRKYSISKKTFNECLTINPENKEAQDGKTKCKQRIHESKTGEYDFDYIIKNSDLMSVECTLRFDVADYKSNLIDVIDIPTKSKGVIAVKEIKRGTLLVVSKAFSITYDSENDGKSKPLYSGYLYENNMQSLQPNVVVAVEAIESNPYLAKEFYQLYAGKYFLIKFIEWKKCSQILLKMNINHVMIIIKYIQFIRYVCN